MLAGASAAARRFGQGRTLAGTQAAEQCPSLLTSNQRLWEKWIFIFSKINQVSMLYIAGPGADVAHCGAKASKSRRRCGSLRARVQLRVIQPYIPVRNPRLSESVYVAATY
jgi:hypothetical protein